MEDMNNQVPDYEEDDEEGEEDVIRDLMRRMRSIRQQIPPNPRTKATDSRFWGIRLFVLSDCTSHSTSMTR
jgi:hypothetical protein